MSGAAGRETGRPGRDPGRHGRPATRWLYARVLLVQLITLAALWLLQATFGSG